jgi:hypothetical protein
MTKQKMKNWTIEHLVKWIYQVCTRQEQKNKNLSKGQISFPVNIVQLPETLQYPLIQVTGLLNKNIYNYVKEYYYQTIEKQNNSSLLCKESDTISIYRQTNCTTLI